MTFLPLVERELRAATRQPYARRLRTGVATSAMVIAIWGLWAWSSWIAGALVGHSLFRTLAGIAFVGSLSAGVLWTADVISQERREGTLGLLFLTDLRPADVVLGKLAAKAVLPFYGLLALLPALAVFTVAGGVTAGELWRTMLALANTLFVSLAVALFTSLFCREQRLAHALAFLAIALLAIPSVALQMIGPLSFATAYEELVALMSLTTTFTFADERRFQSAPSLFFGSLVGTHLLAWICLALACWLAPRIQRQHSLAPARLTWTRGRDWLKRTLLTPRVRQRVLEGNPVTWLSIRDPLRTYAVWTLPIVLIAILSALYLVVRSTAQAIAILLCVIVIQIVFRLWLALDASHAFNASRRNGTLESLLGTPLSPREIGEGMVSGLRQRFIWPGVALATLGLGAAAYFATAGNGLLAAAVFVAAITLLVDIPCITWVGLWRGLASSGSTAAIVSTLARTLVLPLAWPAILKGLFNQSSDGEFLGIYFVAALVNNLLFRASARSRLCEHFRTLALRPYGGKTPHIESKWSPINWEGELAESEETLAMAAIPPAGQ
jgi:hypothetical protein